MTPTHYAKQEGGLWHPWEGGEVDTVLAAAMVFDATSDGKKEYKLGKIVEINGVECHSFMNEVGEFTRWDCVNGWTHPKRMADLWTDLFRNGWDDPVC